MKRPIRTLLLATTIIISPALAYADPVTLTTLAATLGGAAITGAVGGTLGLILGAVFTAAVGFLANKFLGPSLQSQSSSRTREFNPHPKFRFAFGEFPLEGSVVWHHVRGRFYYVAYLLNSIPIEEVNRVVIQEHTDLEIDSLGDNIYDMQATGNDVNPTASTLWNDRDFLLWVGRGDQTQPPQQMLDEINDTTILKSTDSWFGKAVAWVRYSVGAAELQAARLSFGKPPPLRFYGRWSKLFDPRKDPSTSVTQIGTVVVSMALTAPPSDSPSPADGDVYVVASPATGAWAGQETNLATWNEVASPTGWSFAAPTGGQQVWNTADNTQYTWDDSVSPAVWTAGQAGHDRDDATTWEWSANPALAALTLVRHQYALAFDDEIIPIQQYADAADAADAEFSAAAQSAGTISPSSNLRLSLAFEGTHGASAPADFVDSSDFARTPSLVNRASISSVTSNTGDTSVRIDSGSFPATVINYDDLNVTGEPSTNHTRDLRPGAAEFDFSVAINPDATTSAQTIIATNDSSTVRTYLWRVLSGGVLEFTGWGVEGNQVGEVTDASTAVITLTSDPGAIIAGTWQTVRVWREDDDWYMSVDGDVVASDLAHAATLFTGSIDIMDFKIGRYQNSLDKYTGYMDDLRIVINQFVADAPNVSTAPWGCNGIVEINSRELELLDPVLDCMAGHLDTTEGLIGIRAGVWVAPTDTLSEPIGDDITMDGAVDAGFDMVRGKFINADLDWTEGDGPGYALRAGFRVHPLELPLVANIVQVSKLEKIAALRAEPNRIFNATWDAREANRRIGERVNFSLTGSARTSSTYVIDSKSITVEEVDDERGTGLAVRVNMKLIEDVAATYDAPDFSPPDAFVPPTVAEPGMDPPSTVLIEQSNYSDGGTAAARLKVTVTLTQAVADVAQRIAIEVTDGSGYLDFALLDVDDATLSYSTFSATFAPASVGLTYTARARTESDTNGASEWVVGNSVIIVTPALDYSSADYSSEYA